jgi:inorganic pyrophosphatase
MLNYVCEIPRLSAAKMEVVLDQPGNPIRQDLVTVTSSGSQQPRKKLRFYSEKIPWNYGMLPRTWEAPHHRWSDISGLPGDGDPLDVIEVSRKRSLTGGVYRVKVFGAFALIDGGEVDWKILAIRADDPLASKIQDIDDVEREVPGELDRIRTWFRDYKVAQGKPPNKYGFEGRALDAKTAMRVVALAHRLYLRRPPVSAAHPGH